MTTKYQPNDANQYAKIAHGTEVVEPEYDPQGNCPSLCSRPAKWLRIDDTAFAVEQLLHDATRKLTQAPPSEPSGYAQRGALSVSRLTSVARLTCDADIHLMSVTMQGSPQSSPHSPSEELGTAGHGATGSVASGQARSLPYLSQYNAVDEAPSKTTTTRFVYDALHRRLGRVKDYGETTVFMYEGWSRAGGMEARQTNGLGRLGRQPRVRERSARVNCFVIAEKTVRWAVAGEGEKVELETRYTWGEDLSGTLQGAGGIGGLLRSVNSTENRELRTENIFHYDSNGNVILLTDGLGREMGRYAYDAFGKTLTATGPAARVNRYRFSTKPVEEESGVVYYGYRYYDPVTGRWPSRDPIEEQGGINVYGAVQNAFVSAHDVLGLVEGDASECKDDNDVGKIRSSCELTWTTGLHPLADQSAREVVKKVGERYGVPGQISVGIFVAGQAGLQQLLTTFGGNLNFYFRKAEETCTKSSWLGFCVSYSWEKNSENIANWTYFDTMLLNQALTQGDVYIQPFRKAWEATVGNCR